MFEYVAPAPVIENIAPAPAVTFDAPSQQLPLAYTMTTVTADVSFDITGLVNPHFSITAVEASAPQAVGSLPPLEEFDAPVYKQIHQEQIVAGETTQNTFENPAVQEQVIVQEIPQAPQVVASLGRCCRTRVQPSPSGTYRCDSTAACYFPRNPRESGCGADTGTNC